MSETPLPQEQLARLYARIDAMPPLPDEELDALADALVALRLRDGGDAA